MERLIDIFVFADVSLVYAGLPFNVGMSIEVNRVDYVILYWYDYLVKFVNPLWVRFVDFKILKYLNTRKISRALLVLHKTFLVSVFLSRMTAPSRFPLANFYLSLCQDSLYIYLCKKTDDLIRFFR